MTIVVPGSLCWPVHRVAVARLYADTYAGIMDTWTLAEVVDANAVCDAIEDARAEAAAK